MKKPIRVFYSPSTGRFYASQYYKSFGGIFTEITGAKYDVTDDIGHAVCEFGIKFNPVTARQTAEDESLAV